MPPSFLPLMPSPVVCRVGVALVLAAALGVPSLRLMAQAPDAVVFAQPEAGEAERGLSLDRAVALAQQRYHARVVRANVSEAGGRRVYVLKLLSEQGRVWNVRVDAASGEMN